ncbi:MAG: hypothetical protein VYB37_00885 [Pseudomonadota bacterium]|jgi:hypothetical protein|nr:hypothetical protein [Pseudomonadota bacterium]
MAKEARVSVEFELYSDSINMLEHAKTLYDIRTTSKVLRTILDYVIEEADWDTVFKKKRCLRCGDREGWHKSA